MRARFQPDPIDGAPFGEFKPCGRSRCQTCKMITPSHTAISSSCAKVKLKGDTSCRTLRSTMISYGKYEKQYVEETKGPLNIRMNGHRDDWRHKIFERSSVAKHFIRVSHLSVCCLNKARKSC